MIIKFIDNKSNGISSIILLAIINSLFYNLFFDNLIYGDANEYNLLAKNIIKGYFSLSVDDIADLSMKREPLYPFLLSLTYKIFGSNSFFIHIIQIILFSGISLLTYLLSKEIFNHRVSLFSALLVSILPTLANYTSYLLTEVLFSFLLILFIYLITLAFKNNKIYLYCFAGSILGLGALTKAILTPVFIFIILIIFFYKIHNIPYKNLIVFLLSYIIIIFPWSYRNFQNFDSFQISLRGGDALWMSASTLDYTSDQIKQNLIFNFSEYLGDKIYPNLVNNPRDFILMRNDLYFDKFENLRSKNLNPKEIDKLLTSEALNKIKKKPHIYAIQRFLELQKMLAFLYIPALNQTHFYTEFIKKKNGNLKLSLIKAPFKIIGYLMFFISLISFFLHKKEFKNYVFIFFIIFYINLTYSLLFGLGRYSVPLIPFYVIFFTSSLMFVCKKSIYRNK